MLWIKWSVEKIASIFHYENKTYNLTTEHFGFCNKMVDTSKKKQLLTLNRNKHWKEKKNKVNTASNSILSSDYNFTSKLLQSLLTERLSNPYISLFFVFLGSNNKIIY